VISVPITQKWVELTALVTWWFLYIVLMQNKKSWCKEKIANMIKLKTRSKVSDQGLKFCGARLGRAIFSSYQLFLFCIKTIYKNQQVSKAVSSTHFWVLYIYIYIFVTWKFNWKRGSRKPPSWCHINLNFFAVGSAMTKTLLSLKTLA
jgi:hypothetical protein